MNNDGALRLTAAIITLARKDYRLALLRYHTAKGRGSKTEHARQIEKLEQFFREEMSYYCSLNADYIIKRVRRDVIRELRTKGIEVKT